MIENLSTIISLFTAAKSGYELVSNVRKGSDAKNLIKQLEQLNVTAERIGDHILYAPQAQLVRDIGLEAQKTLIDLRAVREQLEPLQKIM